MKAHTHLFPVVKMAAVLGVSRSGYYKWLVCGTLSDPVKDEFDVHIERTFASSRQTYGSPRITQQLEQEGIKLSASTVARRMKRLGISARRRKKYVHTTNSAHDQHTAPNVLDRDFEAERPATKWVSDLTYFKIARQWYYLTIVLDLADRAIVGWAISDNMTSEDTVMAALHKAVENRRPQPGLIFHSDQGVQYASLAFREELADLGAVQSMSAKGNCWDNAVAESFFKTIKSECIDRHTFLNLKQAWSTIFAYIDGWYNTKRIHTSIGGMTPQQAFEIKTKIHSAA